MTCCLSLDSAWSTSFVRKTPWRICLSGHLRSRSCNSRTILSNSFHSKPRRLSTTSSVRLLDFQVFRREFQLSTRRLHPDILQKPETQCIKNKLPFHLHAHYFLHLGLPPTFIQPPIPVNFTEQIMSCICPQFSLPIPIHIPILL